jgi:hypothetical protein
MNETKRYRTEQISGVGWAVVDTENGRKTVAQRKFASDADAVAANLNSALPAETVAKFEGMRDLEFAVMGDRASVAFAPSNLPGYLHDMRTNALLKSRARLSAAVDALTPTELAAYGPWRHADLLR